MIVWLKEAWGLCKANQQFSYFSNILYFQLALINYWPNAFLSSIRVSYICVNFVRVNKGCAAEFKYGQTWKTWPSWLNLSLYSTFKVFSYTFSLAVVQWISGWREKTRCRTAVLQMHINKGGQLNGSLEVLISFQFCVS